jgi:hypothetical protein
VAAVEEGGLGEAGDHAGACRGVPSLPYLVISMLSKTSVGEATGWRTGVCKLSISSTPSAWGQGLVGDVGWHHDQRQAGAEMLRAAAGSTQVLNPAARGMVPTPKQAPRIRTMSGTRGRCRGP